LSNEPPVSRHSGKAIRREPSWAAWRETSATLAMVWIGLPGTGCICAAEIFMGFLFYGVEHAWTVRRACSCTERRCLVLGDAHGVVHLVHELRVDLGGVLVDHRA